VNVGGFEFESFPITDEPLTIYGYEEDSEYDEDHEYIDNGLEKGFVNGYWFSVLCVDGEYGAHPLDRMESISEADFEAAKQRRWMEGMMDCVDLRPWAESHRYRWKFEEAHSGAEADAEWFVEVLCRYGRIYPKGGNTLLAYCTRGIKRHVAKIKGAEHHQSDGDNEVLRFPADRLDEVAAILKPKRLPGPQLLTPEHREKLKQYAFRPGQNAPKTSRKAKGEGSQGSGGQNG
jgi:hypothetical protein